MKEFKYVNVSVVDRIGTIEFNYGQKLNSLSDCFIEDIIDALDELNTPEVRVVIFRAKKGVKVYSAGHDIAELPKTKRDPLSYLDPLRQITRTIQRFPKPVISMVQGSVWGGAFEMTMSTDIVISSDKSTFAFTPVNLGVPYNIVGIHNILRDAGVHNIKEIIFTAKPITAECAYKMGLVNHVRNDDELETFTMDLARLIATKAPLAIEVIKEEIRVLSEANTINPDEYERLQGMRRKVYDSDDYQEGLAAFYDKRKPDFQAK